MLNKPHPPIEIDASGDTPHNPVKRLGGADMKCYWCNCAFRARQSGGHAQRFCSPSCRRAFHTAARREVNPHDNDPIIDRIDLKKGFVPGNVRVVSGKPYKMRHHLGMSLDEIRQWAERQSAK